MVTKAPWLSLSVPNVKRLHWLPVKFCIHFKTSIITYRTLKDNRSVNLTELLAQPKCSKYLRFTFPYENKPRVMSILALKLLAFTTRPMVRSTHLALSPIRFTYQFDFAVSDRYIGKRKYILHRWYGEMSSSQHSSPHQARAFRRGLDVMTSAEMSPSRLPNDAVCI